MLAVSSSASAQSPGAPAAPPPKIWTVEASAGLTVTSGNTDTSTVNGGYKLVYDPQHANVVKSDALILYGRTAGVATTDRADWTVRDEYKLDGHWAAFVGNEYLRDTFKDIRYLVAPAAGVSYHVGSEQTDISGNERRRRRRMGARRECTHSARPERSRPTRNSRAR